MRRIVTATAVGLALLATPLAGASEQPHWHGIFIDGLNVIWIAAGPTQAVQVAAAAYKQIGDLKYLDAQFTFQAVPADGKVTLLAAGPAGCGIELSFAGNGLVAHENGGCGRGDVSFDGTYIRQ